MVGFSNFHPFADLPCSVLSRMPAVLQVRAVGGAAGGSIVSEDEEQSRATSRVTRSSRGGDEGEGYREHLSTGLR